ncbi:PKD domain-containing protein [Flavobacterium sp. XGLA_31]|uniref:PKD domain-containing protein n=1 Tax=Flavobacterium sp. XGLA_31 TaxID=3447666 RepID=UPI003F34B2DF
MKQKLIQKILFAAVYGVFLLGSISTHGQASGVFINWDREVGCQFFEDTRDPKDLFAAEISDSRCVRVCANSTVTYTLTGNNNVPINATWSAVGGAIIVYSGDSCTIQWGAAGNAASITFTLTTYTGQLITKSICFEKMEVPEASFIVYPFEPKNKTYTVCRNQIINFTNTSSPVNASGQDSFYWDFSDGSYSSAISPSHSFNEVRDYDVILQVTNGCGCTSKFVRTVHVIEADAINITCPTVVCEGQTATYSLPFEESKVCDKFEWLVYGGQPHLDLLTGQMVTPVSPNPITINQATGAATVTWATVDSSGFGYLTFYPNEECTIKCLQPTTIKIPVIQAHGTIVGDKTLCIDQQAIYKLPQWPATDFRWEVVENTTGNILVDVFPTDQRNEVVINPHQYGTFTLRATYVNTLLHCGGAAEIKFTVSPPIEISGPTELCQGSSGNYTTATGISTPWVLTDSSGTIVKQKSSSTTFSYTFNQPGTYVLTAGSKTSCPAFQRIIKINPVPQPPVAVVETVNAAGTTSFSIPTDVPVCPNAPYTYSIVQPDSNIVYTWTITNGVFLGPSTGPSVNVSFTGTTNPQLSVTATLNGCSSGPVVYNIVGQEIKAKINNATEEQICANSYGDYQVNQLISGPLTLYTEGESYNWSLSDPTLGSITEGQGTNKIKVLWNNVLDQTDATLYVVIKKCTLTTPLPSAPNVIQLPIKINPEPTLNLTSTSAISCTDQTVTFTAEPTVPITSGTVTWDFGNGLSVPGSLTGEQHTYGLSGVNQITHVTVTVTNPNGCSSISTASTNVAIAPGVVAIASLSSSTMSFCTISEINAMLTATTSQGATIQWHYVAFGQDMTITGSAGTGTTLTVNSSVGGFGYYYFVATDASGCSKSSNGITIFQHCTGSVACDYTPTPTIDNESYQTCDESGSGSGNLIHLVKNITPSPNPDFTGGTWFIFGPNVSLANSSITTFVPTAPGQYSTYYQAGFTNVHNQVCQFTSNVRIITVPYLPSFSYLPICDGNNRFTLYLTDTTQYFAGLTSSSIQYQYAPHGTNNWTTVTGNTIPNVGSGTYDIKITVSGSMGSITFGACEATLTTQQLSTIPPFTSISLPSNASCYDSAVNYILTPALTGANSYLWTFEPETANETTNTLPNPKRTYPTSGPKTVKVTVTNSSGCTLTLADSTTVIPLKCFNGTIKAVPETPVCKGQMVTLSYLPQNDACDVQNYIWMKGQDPIPNTNNAANIQVGSNGFYWVKVRSNLNCVYDTPNRITPTFMPVPSLKIYGPASVCLNDVVTLTAQTNASTIQWSLLGPNGPVYISTSNATTLSFSAYMQGTYTAHVKVTNTEGCFKEEDFTFTTNPAPDVPIISYEVHCANATPDQPYYHAVLTATSNNAAFFNWSNGGTGSEITVLQGGPIRVTALNGGCSSTAQIEVPKSPEDYIWVFPTGCVDFCRIDQNGTLLGPLQTLEGWAWMENGETVSSDDGLTLPYTITNVPESNGTYNLSITSGNCELTSGPLSFTTHGCDECQFTQLNLELKEVTSEPFCTYTVILNIQSPNAGDLTITVLGNSMIVSPNALYMEGTVGYSIPITMVPLSSFAGGTYTVELSGVFAGKICKRQLELHLPECGPKPNKANIEGKNPIFVLAPNPARDSVTMTYSDIASDSSVTVYDLLGRTMGTYSITGITGSMVINTQGYPKGVYIVMVTDANGSQWKQKLIIDTK